MNKGLSGCALELVDTNTIRKSSTNIKYNRRLQTQIEKQKYFLEHFKRVSFNSPHIKKIDGTDLIYYDMEYIPSSSFETFFSESSKDDLDHFYGCLEEYIDSVAFVSRECNQELIEKLHTLRSSSQYASFIDFLIKELHNAKIILPIGFCHGDLTLSNILFKHRTYYLIDFLDSHIETPYYDLAKLKQDLFYHWSVSVNHINNLRVKQGIDYVWSLLLEDYNDCLNSKEFHFIDALTLLRIEPYICDTEITQILQECIHRLELYEKFIAADGR